MREREISLIDLLVEILLRWRLIVVLMLVGGILLGAFSFVRSSQSSQSQAAKADELRARLDEEELLGRDFDRDVLNAAIDLWISGEEADFQSAFMEEEAEEEEEQNLKEAVKDWIRGKDIDIEEMLREWAEDDKIALKDAFKLWLDKEVTVAQKSNVDYTIYYEDLFRNRQEYKEQSVYMQIDSNDAKRADITFLVEANGQDRTYNIERVYEDVINSFELASKIADKAGLPVAAVSDIYSLTRGSGGLERGSDSFRVTLYHYNEKKCRELAEVIVDYVDQKHDEIEETLGEHSVTVLNQTVGTAASSGILSTQRNFDADLLSLESAYESRKSAFTDEEWYYYNMVTTGKIAGNPDWEIWEEDEEADKEELKATEEFKAAQRTENTKKVDEVIGAKIAVPSPGVSLKYIILGMIMAAFLYAFVIFMLYVLDNHLRATDQLQELYGIPQLGQIPGERKGKKAFGFVDEWILKLRYYNQRKFTAKEAQNLAAVAVKMAAGKNDLETVYLIGCDLKAQGMKCCEQIKAFLEEEHIKTQILSNVLYDAEAMEKLGNARGVVLVEKAGSTLYTEIAQELELLKRQDIAVLGGIIVE